ncbi:MAG: 50S ribosomal protein L23 [Leptospiraceae bacterium]|nr:50S ribosomal protein L23 [Leptospiraceae bacterium]MDW8306080.1 50S ribosomal protein L23 [Leptospiraceae bacterium]
MDLYDVIRRPIVTEKAEMLRKQNCYAFEVDPRANKVLVAQAIKQIYGISPLKVNIVNEKPKQKNNRMGIGFRSRRKKAYVFLKPNDKINLFEGV